VRRKKATRALNNQRSDVSGALAVSGREVAGFGGFNTTEMGGRNVKVPTRQKKKQQKNCSESA
jgi:hypothetical protein